MYDRTIGQTYTRTVTLSTAADGLSDAIDIGGGRLAAVHMSTAWTAADISFAAAPTSSGEYQPVFDDLGNEVKLTVAASRTVSVDSYGGALAPLQFIKLRSGGSTAIVAQVDARTLTLILKG